MKTLQKQNRKVVCLFAAVFLLKRRSRGLDKREVACDAAPSLKMCSTRVLLEADDTDSPITHTMLSLVGFLTSRT